MPIDRWFSRLNLITVAACFALVVLGAYVRLSDAGLGCPDWPGCYGQMVVPTAENAAQHADFPARPFHVAKAWKEMVHRYLAGLVGMMVLLMALVAAARRARGLPAGLALAILLLVIVQAVFGALTVTWQVMPVIVTTHLLLGLLTLMLLWWMWLRQAAPAPPQLRLPWFRAWSALALCVLALQVFLGGWTSTNYAAIGCPDFPTCQGVYRLQTGLAPAFDLWHGLGIDYQGGVLSASVRATIHMVHRYGALLTALVVGALALYLWIAASQRIGRALAALLLLALALQILIGIAFVEGGFPLWLADAHTGGAAVLLLVVVLVNHLAWRSRAAGEDGA
ncbi:MAG TPA: COX15/CtaA family protein [Nevskiaceae bacterium]